MTQRLDAPSAAVRIRAMKRDRFACTYCGVPGTDAELEIDHIVSVANGGSHHISNLTTACRACNQKKGKGCAPPRFHKGTRSLDSERLSTVVGMFLHTFNDEQRIEFQGHIVAVDGETVLVELFSWLDGSPTHVRPMPKTLIYSDKCRLYLDADAMHEAWQMDGLRRKSRGDPDYEFFERCERGW